MTCPLLATDSILMGNGITMCNEELHLSYLSRKIIFFSPSSMCLPDLYSINASYLVHESSLIISSLAYETTFEIGSESDKMKKGYFSI